MCVLTSVSQITCRCVIMQWYLDIPTDVSPGDCYRTFPWTFLSHGLFSPIFFHQKISPRHFPWKISRTFLPPSLCPGQLSFTPHGLFVKGQLQWKKSNRQNYKRRVVYLETSKFEILVYYCNVCTRRKTILKFVLSNELSTNFWAMLYA